MSRITIELDPDERHPHHRHYQSERFLVFWLDQFGTVRFAAVPGDDDEWERIMDGIESGEVGILEEDEPD